MYVCMYLTKDMGLSTEVQVHKLMGTKVIIKKLGVH